MENDTRNYYEMPHFNCSCGAIGSLQTLATYPVVAGESIYIDYNALFRLAPLVRPLYIEPVVDLYLFWVPHRIVYGLSDWIAFIEAGVDESTTFGTRTVNGDVLCCGWKMDTANNPHPKWALDGYPLIWNNYFKEPSDTAGDLSTSYLPGLTTEDVLKYGHPICHLPDTWTVGNYYDNITTADYQITLSGSVLDLLDMSQLQGRLNQELDTAWYGMRYEEIMRYQFGSKIDMVSIDKPELLMRSSTQMSAGEVEGTDASTLGYVSGIGKGIARIEMPMRFFPEHGTIWLQAAVRFKPIHNNINHYLVGKSEPTYKELSGSPSVLNNEPPLTVYADDLIYTASHDDIGKYPYGWWYRTHPDCIHYNYGLMTGHPFLTAAPDNLATSHYIANTLYNPLFMTDTLKHWNCQGHCDFNKLSFVPPLEVGIKSGVHSNV